MTLLYTLCACFSMVCLHELSHVFMAELLVGVRSYKINLFPHRSPSLGSVSASVSIWYERNPSEKEEAWVAFAPRVYDLLSCVAFLSTENPIIFALSCGGLADLFIASTEIGKSDLLVYSKNWGLEYEETRKNTALFLVSVLALYSINQLG